jgi:hypothetical protein
MELFQRWNYVLFIIYVHETLRQKLKDLLSMIPNYKNPVHKYDLNPSKTQLETVEECSLTEVNMKEFGIRTRSHNKNANESDSDDEMGGWATPVQTDVRVRQNKSDCFF